MAFHPSALLERWPQLRPYVVSLLAVTVAFFVRFELDPWLGDRQPFLTFMGAVIFTAWFGGLGPSLVALILGALAASWFFLPPRHDLMIVGSVHQIALLGFVSLGFTIVALGATLWRAKLQVIRSVALYDAQGRELDAERKRVHRELSRLSEELRDVDRRRENFLALLADELRRPLAPIASAASLHRVAATASEMEAAMDIVKQEMTQLGHLIDDLVDAFQSTNGPVDFRPQRLDLVEVVHRAASALRSLSAQSGRELNVSLSKMPVVVNGDPGRLVRVAYNLLTNAVRSTNPGGQIWVSVAARDGSAVFKVKDTGPGLSPDEAERVFQVDSQLDGHIPRERGGGISLLAVKPIVEMHGGTVTVVSEGPGQGCEFILALPLAPGEISAESGEQAPQRASSPPAS